MGIILDYEYSTNSIKEKQYLDKLKIRYSFVKVINGVTIYKYTKSKKLFTALAQIYD